MSNNKALRDLMEDYRLPRKVVASLTCASKSAVDRWLVPEHLDVKGKIEVNPSFRHMPNNRLMLLRIGLERRKKA